MRVVLKVIENLTEEKPKGSGKFHTIRRGIVSKIALNTEDFVPREMYNDKGIPVKGRTLIIHNKLGEMVVKHKFEDVVEMGAQESRTVIKGFRK